MIKTLHILGVVFFLGNSIIGAFWRLSVLKSKDISVVRHALKLTKLTDWVFTLPGALLIGVTGHMLAPKFGGIAAFGWIYHSYAMLTVAVLMWLAGMLPIQLKQIRMLNEDDVGHLSPQFQKLTLIWNTLGIIAMLLTLVALYLMVVRPV